MKKKLTLSVCIASLITLCAFAYFLNGDALASSTSEPISAQKITKKITQIKYANADGEETELKYSVDKWILATDESFPLSQTYPLAMVNYISEVLATRYVGEAENLEEYGLSSPSLTISLGLENGEKAECLIGNKNTHTGDYYFKTSNSNSIYTINYALADAFSYNYLDMAELSAIPTFDANDLLSVEIKQGGETYSLHMQTVTSETEGEESVIESSISSSQTQREYTLNYNGKTILASSTLCDELMYSIKAITLNSCAAYNPVLLDDFGLKNKSAEISVKYNTEDGEKSFTVFVGAGAADGSRYVMLSNELIVYKTNANMVSDILTVTASDLIA